MPLASMMLTKPAPATYTRCECASYLRKLMVPPTVIVCKILSPAQTLISVVLQITLTELPPPTKVYLPSVLVSTHAIGMLAEIVSTSTLSEGVTTETLPPEHPTYTLPPFGTWERATGVQPVSGTCFTSESVESTTPRVPMPDRAI